MRVLITGGKGFIGTPIEKYLAELNQSTEKVEVSYYDIAEGNDVLDFVNLLNAISEVDAVIHLAGVLGTDKTIKSSMLTRKALMTNVIGGFNVLDACQKLNKKLIIMDNGNYWMDSPYPASKTCIVKIAKSFAKSKGLRVDIVRAYNVYGEGQSLKQNKYAPNFIIAALTNQPLVVYGDGQNELDAIYVDDCAKVIADVLLTKNGDGTIYEAGTGKGYTAEAFARLVIELTGSKSELQFVPMRAGEDEHAKVVAEKPYYDTWSDLETTLRSTIDYYAKQIGVTEYKHG